MSTTRFTLTIVDDDHMILSTDRSDLTSEAHHEIQAAFDRWKENGGVAIVADCVVRDERQKSIELDLGWGHSDVSELGRRDSSEADVRHERLLEGDDGYRATAAVQRRRFRMPGGRG